jgi:hypothetical protein
MKKRLKFRCWSCEREYSMTRAIEGKPELIVACPYCEQEGAVDLSRYRTTVRNVFRGDIAPDSQGVAASAGEPAASYDFPELIPTTAPKTRT